MKDRNAVITCRRGKGTSKGQATELIRGCNRCSGSMTLARPRKII